MKAIFLYLLLAILSACGNETAQTAEPQKPKAIQDAEQVEEILKQKAEADKKLIDEQGVKESE